MVSFSCIFQFRDTVPFLTRRMGAMVADLAAEAAIGVIHMPAQDGMNLVEGQESPRKRLAPFGMG